MSVNPLNDISAVYAQEVFKPQLGKSAPSGDGPKKVEKGKDDAESSAKRIRQATYDIRYRARREDIKLDQAFTQYMGHTTMSGPEKAAVKEKLGLTDVAGGGSDVKEEVEGKKFKVRVTDKESGKSYVRYATREKINQLRANPNISSVEMTGYGSPYEGEKKKGESTAAVKSGKGLDPVGREDKDIDNDGDHDKSDKYLLNRRKVRGAAIAKKGAVKEGFSDWREDLREVLDVVDKEDNEKQITGLKAGQKNNIKTSALKGGINFKEAVEAMGGELLEMVELDEKAPPGAKYERMVKHIKKGYSEDGLTKKEKSIAYATAWKAKNKEVKEAAPATPVAQTQQDTQNKQQDQQRAKLQDRKLASIQKTQLAAKMKQVQQGIPLKDSYEIEPIDEKNAEIEAKFKKAKTPYLLSKFRSENPGSRQPKKVPGAKETPSDAQRRLVNRQVSRAVKHGLTSKEKAETQARAKYDSPRD